MLEAQAAVAMAEKGQDHVQVIPSVIGFEPTGEEQQINGTVLPEAINTCTFDATLIGFCQ